MKGVEAKGASICKDPGRFHLPGEAKCQPRGTGVGSTRGRGARSPPTPVYQSPLRTALPGSVKARARWSPVKDV